MYPIKPMRAVHPRTKHP